MRLRPPARPRGFADAIPLRDAQRRARSLQGRAASFRSIAGGIRSHYDHLIDRDGLDACARRAEGGRRIQMAAGTVLG
ncbi:MAG: hypothetical protein QCH35_06115 [Methanomicrobiaceae archaeon]|nr:hypothetical protein [Methanomicrobiaceae archaeon]